MPTVDALKVSKYNALIQFNLVHDELSRDLSDPNIVDSELKRVLEKLNLKFNAYQQAVVDVAVKEDEDPTSGVYATEIDAAYQKGQKLEKAVFGRLSQSGNTPSASQRADMLWTDLDAQSRAFDSTNTTVLNLIDDEGEFPVEHIAFVESRIKYMDDVFTKQMTAIIDKLRTRFDAAVAQRATQKFADLRDHSHAKITHLTKLLYQAKASAAAQNLQSGSRPGTPSSTASSLSTSLEKMKPPVLVPNARKYPTFRKEFDEIVSSRVPDRKDQLAVLKNKCLPDVAKDLVAHCGDIEEAWEILDDMYGQEADMLQAVQAELASFRIDYKNPHQDVIKYVNAIDTAVADMKAVKIHRRLCDFPTFIRSILTKLPMRARVDWNKQKDSQHGASEWESFHEFLKDERRLARNLLNDDQDPMNLFGKQDEKKDQQARSGKVNTAKVKKKLPDGCFLHPDLDHFTRKCRKFESMSVDERVQAVKNAKACQFCLSKAHEDTTEKPCPKRESWKPCRKAGCNKYHSEFLHKDAEAKVNTASTSASVAMLLVQSVEIHGGQVTVLWDTGATVSLIARQAAARMKLRGTPVAYDIFTPGNDPKNIQSVMYTLMMEDTRGEKHSVELLELDFIGSESSLAGYNTVASLFPSVDRELLRRPVGDIDILIGIDHVGLHPFKHEEVGQLGLFKSQFGSGWLLGGAHSVLKTPAGVAKVSVNYVKYGSVSPEFERPDFFTAEGFGVNVQPKCGRCKACAECSFINQQLSRKEKFEYELIKNNMHHDEEGKFWLVTYPFIGDPDKLHDNYGQVVSLLERQEKRLAKAPDVAKAYSEEMDKFMARGVIKEIPVEELEAYKGPINYIAHHEVYKPDSTTTPVRIVSNSSLEYRGVSLNSLLPKGPNSLNSLIVVMFRFREKLIALVADMTKAYQTMKTGIKERHLRRLVWRGLDTTIKPKIYGMETVTFGDRPAAAQLEIAKRILAEKYEDINPLAARAIKEESYVDDITSGADEQAEVDRLKADIPDILGRGGFKLKHIVTTGQPVEGGMKVLGVKWDPLNDTLAVEVNINLSKKVKGKHVDPDLSLEQISELGQAVLTRRKLLAIAHSCYDPLGFVSPITVAMKIKMRDLYSKDLALGWDTPIPVQMRDAWVKIFQEVKRSEAVTFQRSFKSQEGRKPALVLFWDASDEAVCVVAYMVWHIEGQPNDVKFVIGKTRVNPLNRISTPRAEMNAATMSVRVRRTICQAITFEVNEIYHLGDSQCVLALLKKDSVSLKEYMGNRVTEVIEGSDEKDWFHVPGAINVADLGTRGARCL